MNPWQRAVVALLLLAALGGLFVHTDLTSEARSPYPAPDEIAADYDSYVGETVLLFGDVTSVGSAGFTIEAESEGVTIELQIDGASPAVDPGGVVQVYGELRPDQRMTAQRVVVGVGGAAIPDLVKVGIVLDSNTVEAALDVPFTYSPLSTLGGVLVVCGGLSSLVGDGL